MCTNSPKDQGLIPDRVRTKTLKMVLDASFFNTNYGSRVSKGSRKRGCALP